MEPGRFVTYAFIYSGAVMLLQFALVDQFQLAGPGIGNLGVGSVLILLGLYRRLNSDTAERSPSEYGLFTYAMAALVVLVTAIFLASLYVG